MCKRQLKRRKATATIDCLALWQCPVRCVCASDFINGANIQTEPINMPTYRSLLFAPFHVWLFHAIGHFFLHPTYRFLWPKNSVFFFLLLSRATVALFSRTSISFTSQLGPNNPNKWTNWEITSNWTEQWKLISHSKWAWQLQLQLQSSPSCIWASCLLDQCACNAFFLAFSPVSIVIQLFNSFSTCCVRACVLVCCLHFEFTVINVKIMNDIFNTKFSTGQLACEKWQCLNRIFHVVPMGVCDLLLWQHVSHAAVYSPFDSECWNYARIELLLIKDIFVRKKISQHFLR